MVVAETRAQAMDAAEAVEVEYEELPFVIALRGRARARRADGVGRGARQRAGRHDVRRQGRDRSRLRRGRPCGEGGVQHRPRHRACRWSCAPASPITTPRPAATRSTPAPAARCGRRPSLPACSASRPTSCACCPTTSAAISARATGPIVEFGLVLWAAGKLKRPVKYTATRSEAFLTDYQGRDLVTKVELAFDARTAASSRCAPTTSATSARAASRCRRCRRARA